MATIKSDQVTSNGPRSVHGDAREHQTMLTTTSITAAPAVSDIWQLGYLPANAVVVGAGFVASQMDTNGSPTLAIEVGDAGYTGVAGDVARYFPTATAVGRAATGADANANFTPNGRVRLFKNTSGAPILVFATVTAVAATFAAGTFQWEVTYLIDEPQSLLNQ